MLKFSYLSEAGERAFGPFENPSFVRTSTREYANQIFVDGYMKLLVVRYVNWPASIHHITLASTSNLSVCTRPPHKILYPASDSD